MDKDEDGKTRIRGLICCLGSGDEIGRSRDEMVVVLSL